MCDCHVCQRHRSVQAQLDQLPQPQRAFFESLLDTLDNVEMDRDYYRAILDGSWPDADRVLAGFRARHATQPAAAGAQG